MYFDTFQTSFRVAMTNSMACGLGLLALSQASTATAQTPAQDATTANQLEEIVVTARKQRESIMDVPVAASVVSSGDLERYAIRDVTGIRVPSVNLDRTATGGGGSLTIRGIGSSTFDTGIEQAVATVIDGVQTSRGNFIEAGLLDLSLVEVLKGPQALFFGKNSPGGVLSLNSSGPTDQLSGYVRTGYEVNAEEKTVEGAISGPLTDHLRARVAIRGTQMEGWLDNTSTSVANPYAAIPGNSSTLVAPPYQSNESESVMGRVTIDYKPTSDFTATWRLLGATSEDNGPNANTEVSNCTVPPYPDNLGVVDLSGDCRIDGRNSLGPVPAQIAASNPIFKGSKPYGEFDAYLTSLTMDYSTGSVDITSVTGYMDYRYKRVLTRPITVNYGYLAEDENFNQFTQELRAVSHFDLPLNFSAGLYYESNELTTDYPNALVPHLADPVTGSFLTYIFNQGSKGKSYSAFVQGRWDIAEQWELAAGVRYSEDERDGFVTNSYVNPNAPLPLVAQGTVFSGKRKFNNTSPEVTLSWTPVEDTLFYASYKTGYKSGGVASPAILPITFDSAQGLFYAPEKIKGYEIGFKTQQLDNRLRITAAAFDYEYTDLQLSNFNRTSFAIQALNVGELNSKGFEIEAAYRPMNSLTLNAAVGYSRARYVSFDGISCYGGQTAATGCGADGTQSLADQQKFRSPEWTGNVGLTYETPAFGNYLIGVSGAMRFSSSYFTQENNSPFAVQKAYRIYDASLHLRTEDSQWQFAVIGKNLSDEFYAATSLDMPNALAGTIESVVGRDRQVVMEATFKY